MTTFFAVQFLCSLFFPAGKILEIHNLTRLSALQLLDDIQDSGSG
jgi:hypothetical protein